MHVIHIFSSIISPSDCVSRAPFACEINDFASNRKNVRKSFLQKKTKKVKNNNNKNSIFWG